jgi:hypothetical protein
MPRPRKERPPLRPRNGVWYATVYVNGQPVERSTGERNEAEATRVAEGWQAEAKAQSHPAASPAVALNDVLSELLDDTRAKIKDGRRSQRKAPARILLDLASVQGAQSRSLLHASFPVDERSEGVKVSELVAQLSDDVRVVTLAARDAYPIHERRPEATFRRLEPFRRQEAASGWE